MNDVIARQIIKVTTTRENEVVVVHVAGELDAASVIQLKTTMWHELDAQPAGLVVDLLDVTFCGASGLRVLFEARARAELTQIEMRLVAAELPVVRVLELTGLRHLFTVYDSVAMACVI